LAKGLLPTLKNGKFYKNRRNKTLLRYHARVRTEAAINYAGAELIDLRLERE